MAGRYHPAGIGDPAEIQNAQGSRLYKPVKITWTRPKIWKTDQNAPIDDVEEAPGHLYVLLRDHHRAKAKETIVYVGITNQLDKRFNVHPKAKDLRAMRGDTSLSIGNVDFGTYRTAISHNRDVLEELEHILIWTLNPKYNEKKKNSLPGLSRASRAWHISNVGHRFAGRMPREVVYPWIVLKVGRDRSTKKR